MKQPQEKYITISQIEKILKQIQLEFTPTANAEKPSVSESLNDFKNK